MNDAPHIEVGERYLTVEEARRLMRDELNIPVSERLMRAIVSERRLPFFKCVDGRPRIGERTLKRALADRQAAAWSDAERGAA